MPVSAPNPSPKKRRSLLPLLTVVFLASYALMTMLIVEQGGVIQQQRNLIQVLQGDSTELWAIKGKAVVDKATHAKGQTPAATPNAQTPGSNKKTQSGQSSQAPQHSQTQAKPHVQLPPVPASDLGDHRRVLITL
jgi:hypothetical protein